MSNSGQPMYRQRVGYQAMLLGGFAALASVFLVSGNLATKDAIAERQREDLMASLNQVVPARMYSNDLLHNPLYINDQNDREYRVYRGFLDSQVSVLAWEITEQGYAGDIRMIMGVDSDGNILGVRVISHAETPGLGDKIEPQKDDWIIGFNGLSLGSPPADQWRVTKDGGRFDAFSGATITPRAVVKGIKRGLVFFKGNRSKLLALPEEAISFTSDLSSERQENTSD